MDALKHLNRLQTLLDEMDHGLLNDFHSRLLAFGAAKAIVDELRELNERDFRGNGYALEKLHEYLHRIKVLAALEEDGGHSEQQHIAWAIQALRSLGSKLCFGVWS